MTWILCIACDTVYGGKTVWTSTRSTWSGRRNLVKVDNNTSLTIDGGDVKDLLSMSLNLTLSSDEGLLSTLPSWCSFQGMIRCCTDSWCGNYEIRFYLIWFDILICFGWFYLTCESCHVLCDCLARYASYWYYLDEIRLLIWSIHHIFVTGIECDSITGSATYGRVHSIEVRNMSLTGTLPSSIGNFGSITWMSIEYNDISGTIPSTISGLTSLQYLYFHSNSFVGTIPSTISGLISLQRLYLNINSLIGTIPSAISATSLQELKLFSNSLSGTIPSTMSALTSLGLLSLFNNYLTMGTATSVPISTFSSTTLSGSIDLAENCLVFDTTSPYPSRHVTATHCRSTGKYEVYCPYLECSTVWCG